MNSFTRISLLSMGPNLWCVCMQVLLVNHECYRLEFDNILTCGIILMNLNKKCILEN